MSNIYPYRLADGSEKFQVRMRLNGKRRSVIADTYDEALTKRNALLEGRGDEELARKVLPAERPRGGSQKTRTVTKMIAEEWWPTAKPPKGYTGPTRGAARGSGGAKTLPLSRSTLRTLNWVLRTQINGTELGRMDPTAVDAEAVRLWMEERRARGVSDAVIRQGLKLLSNAFDWAAQRTRQTGIFENPARKVDWPPEVTQKEVQFFEFETTEWLRQWMLHTAPANDLRTRRRKALLFSVMQGSALRPKEARQLRAELISEDRITVPATISKTNRERWIPLWRPTAEELHSYIADYKLRPVEPLFNMGDGQPMSEHAWGKWRQYTFAPARERVQEIIGDERLETAVPYDMCRHRWARAQLAALVPPERVAFHMGHDLATLARVYSGEISSAYATVEQLKKSENPARELYDPEAELIAARKKVEALIPGEIERAQREGKLGDLSFPLSHADEDDGLAAAVAAAQ